MTFTVEQANELVARLEKEGVLAIINEKAGEMFGTKNDFHPVVKRDYKNCAYIELEDKSTDVNDQLTGTPLLRSMFSDAYIRGEFYYFEKEKDCTIWDCDEVMICFHIGYGHPDGGRNGLRLGRLTISMDKAHNTITRMV